MTNELITALDDDAARYALREMLLATDPTALAYNDDDLDLDDSEPDAADALDHANRLHDAYCALLSTPRERDTLTDIALSLSLCPMHLCDYAICFDDDDADCAPIRLIHPSHDT